MKFLKRDISPRIFLNARGWKKNYLVDRKCPTLATELVKGDVFRIMTLKEYLPVFLDPLTSSINLQDLHELIIGYFVDISVLPTTIPKYYPIR